MTVMLPPTETLTQDGQTILDLCFYLPKLQNLSLAIWLKVIPIPWGRMCSLLPTLNQDSMSWDAAGKCQAWGMAIWLSPDIFIAWQWTKAHYAHTITVLCFMTSTEL